MLYEEKALGDVKMFSWLVDFLKCLIHGHCLEGWGNYYYCQRCGHLEVRNELLATDSGAKANDL